MSEKCFLGSEVNCPFVRCYEEVKKEKGFWTRVQLHDGQLIPDLGPSLIVLRRLFSLLYFSECLGYWVNACYFEL